VTTNLVVLGIWQRIEDKMPGRNWTRDDKPLASTKSSKTGATSGRPNPTPEKVRICQSQLNDQIALGGTDVGSGLVVRLRELGSDP
jgi:hypothetical protein